MTAPSWTDERKARLILLWNGSGMSAGQIGKNLGVTRNAVLGMAYRMRHHHGIDLVAKNNGHDGTTRRSILRKDPAPTAQEQNGADGALAKKARKARKAQWEAAKSKKVTHRKVTQRKSAKNGSKKVTTRGCPILYQNLLREQRRGRGNRCLWRVNSHWETRVLCCGAGTPPGKAFCGTHAEAAKPKLEATP